MKTGEVRQSNSILNSSEWILISERPDLTKMLENSLNLVKEVNEYIKENNLYNNQEVIDWQDELNKISVEYQPGK